MRTTPRAIFITATDTGVGKTLVAAMLAGEWRRAGLDVGVVKPFGTEGVRVAGVRGLVSPDALILHEAAGRPADSLRAVSPQCFRAPLAPEIAARIEGKRVDVAAALRAVRAVVRCHEITLIEGCGGLWVPLTPRVAILDVIKRLDASVLVIARSALGTLNHTVLTVDRLRSEGMRVLGVVLNRVAGGALSLAEKTNPKILRCRLDVPVWGPLAFVRSLAGRPLAPADVRHLPRCETTAREILERLASPASGR